MTVRLAVRQVDGIRILAVQGRMTLPENSLAVREAVLDLLNGGSRKILIDLAEVPEINSLGLGELVAVFTTVRSRGGELKLLHLGKRAKDLLLITKLDTVFEAYDDEGRAAASFSASGQ